MSRSELPAEGELQALYREAATEAPESALDRRILDAARAEVRGGAQIGRSRPWWRGWLPVASAIAVAALGISITWRVADQQERELREELNAAADARARPPVSAEIPAAAGSRLDASPTLGSRGANLEAARESSPSPAQPAARQPTLPAAPAPADGAASGGPGIAPEPLREMRDARPPALAAPGAARQAARPEAKGFGVGGDTAAEGSAPSAAKSVAGTAARSAAEALGDAAGPQEWLLRIRELRAAGRVAEAQLSLAQFRARYPDIALPDDLRDMK